MAIKMLGSPTQGDIAGLLVDLGMHVEKSRKILLTACRKALLDDPKLYLNEHQAGKKSVFQPLL
jgi:hypothetical protein